MLFRSALAHAAHSVLITLGAQGVVGVLNEVPVREPAQPVQVIDATGAGDAFCAGVMAGLVRGLTPAAAVQLGTRVAAKILNQIGGLVTDPSLMADLSKESLCKP